MYATPFRNYFGDGESLLIRLQPVFFPGKSEDINLEQKSKDW